MAMRSILSRVLSPGHFTMRTSGLILVDSPNAFPSLSAALSCQRWYSSSPSDEGEAGDSPAEGTENAAAEEEEPQPTRGRRWTRKEKGSWVDNKRLMDELDDLSVGVPRDMPMYDMRTDIPWFYEPRTKYADLLERVAAQDPALLAMLDEPEPPLPYPGARSILHWETQMVLVAGPDELTHPLNRKARCSVFLRDLQQEAGLTDAALQHIALICGPRYNPKKGELTLVCEKYPDREENRRDILDTLHALVAEGERVFPQTDPEIVKLQEERRRARQEQKGTPVPPHISVKQFQEGKKGHSAAVREEDAAA